MCLFETLNRLKCGLFFSKSASCRLVKLHAAESVDPRGRGDG